MNSRRFPLYLGLLALVSLVLLMLIDSQGSVAQAQSFDEIALAGKMVDAQPMESTAVQGDCNEDATIDATDIVAIGQGIFSDGSSAAGCDANEDAQLTAGDISCSALRLFDSSTACEAATRKVTAAIDLTMVQPIYGAAGSRVDVPIMFAANGNTVNSVAFSIDIDETILSFDPADADNNGIPDAVSMTPPAGYNATVLYDASDTDGEIDIFFADVFPPYAPLVDGQIAVIGLDLAGDAVSGVSYSVGFSAEPAPTFGSTRGASETPTTSDGSIIPVEPTSIQLRSQHLTSMRGPIIGFLLLLIVITSLYLFYPRTHES